MCFCHDIRETEREAAEMSTSGLRAAIHANLDIQDAALGNLESACELGDDTQFHAAHDLVFVSALITALYVRELTRRPAEQPTEAVFSVN